MTVSEICLRRWSAPRYRSGSPGANWLVACPPRLAAPLSASVSAGGSSSREASVTAWFSGRSTQSSIIDGGISHHAAIVSIAMSPIYVSATIGWITAFVSSASSSAVGRWSMEIPSGLLLGGGFALKSLIFSEYKTTISFVISNLLDEGAGRRLGAKRASLRFNDPIQTNSDKRPNTVITFVRLLPNRTRFCRGNLPSSAVSGRRIAVSERER